MKRHLGRIHWGTFVFLILFVILLIVVARYALVPGLAAISEKPTTQQSNAIVAWYTLLLFVLLFILFVGIVLTFRFGRLFFPRPTVPRTKTQYTDAWAESGKRMQVPSADEPPDDPPDER